MKGLLKALPVLALIGALAVWALWQQSKPDSAQQALPSWTSFDQAKAGDILIQNRNAPAIHLQRQQSAWMLLPVGDEAPLAADAGAVAHLLADLANMRIVRVVSHQPAHFSRLNVDEKSGAHVIVKDAGGDALLDIFVGKPGSDLISTYVRRSGEDAAVTVNRSLTWQVKRVRSGWQAPEPATPAITPPAPLKPDSVADAYSHS
ncbi:MAG: DUF4340 domain-containing protein [Mariprofundaceae bacterium]